MVYWYVGIHPFEVMIVKDVLVIHYNVLKLLTNNYFLQLRKGENVTKKLYFNSKWCY
jgi:hypothetical protein